MVRPWYWPENGQPHRTEPFTWIVKGKMAASWWPDPPVFEIYKRQGISVIINCSEFDYRKNVTDKFSYYHINVPDYGVPTVKQIERFLKITEEHGNNDEPMVVHCVAGCGRTAQFIVAWASFNGHIPNGIDPVKWIRKKRACSLETKEQMEQARKFAIKFKRKS